LAFVAACDKTPNW